MPVWPEPVTAAASAFASVEGVMNRLFVAVTYTVVISVEKLFVELGSNSVAVTFTELMSGLSVSGCTSIVTVATPPLVRLPRLQITREPMLAQAPCEEKAERKVAPEGSVSMMLTALAVETPRFVTTSV